ncbi:MAG: tetratricopeptide repeat protein [Verrucomicrobiota bacterium]
MNPLKIGSGDVPRRICMVLALGAICAWPLSAQQRSNDLDPVFAYDQAVQAHAAGNWERGLKICDAIIAQYGSYGLREFGPVFGHFYYLKGMMHLGLEQWEPAIEAFKICYEQYRNDMETADKTDAELPLRNRFRIHALVKWGGALQAVEQYGEAIKMYEKALREAPKEEADINTVHVGINLGQCYLRAEQYAKGREYLTKALDSEIAPGLQETVFMVLAEDWSPHVELGELQTYLAEYGDILRKATSYSRMTKNPRVSRLAQLGIEAEDPIRALTWYSYLLNPREIVAAYERRIKLLEEAKAEEDADTEGIDAEIAEKRSEIVDQKEAHVRDVFGVANCQFVINNYSASFAGYRYLADDHPEHPQRPHILHNLVASAVQVGLWNEGYAYGKLFFDEFPNHELRPSLARLLVEVIFLEGEYEEAYRISGDVRMDMERGSVMRDVPDFIYGASAHHLGEFEEADRELGGYLKDYPNGGRTELVKFYYGSNKVKLFEWAEAVRILEEFMAEYPASEMMSTALYEAGLSRFMLDDYTESFTHTMKLQGQYPDALEIPASYNLKGDLLAAMGEASREEVEAAYLEAKTRAEESGGEEATAAYSLWQLAVVAHGAEDWETVAGYFDEYRQEYPDNVFRLDLSATCVEGLSRSGRRDEALATLKEHVLEYSDRPDSVELAEMIGSYVGFVEDHLEVDEALAEIAAFSEEGGEGAPPSVKSWLLVSQIELLEDSEEEARQERARQLIHALNASLKPEASGTYPMVRLARWRTGFLKEPAKADELYDFILTERAKSPGVEFALLDTALAEAKSSDAEQRASALSKFNRVLEEFLVDDLRELATLGIARLKTEDGNFPVALTWWEKYLEDRTWSSARAEANYSLAHCMEENGKKPEALKLYVSVYANFPGHLDWSTKAYIRSATILKGMGEEEKAALVLRDMVERMGHLDHPGVAEGKRMYESMPKPKEVEES